MVALINHLLTYLLTYLLTVTVQFKVSSYCQQRVMEYDTRNVVMNNSDQVM